MRELNREELAWAAGFFDGEGCVFLAHPKISGRQYQQLTLHISQRDSYVLERFQQAVGGLGKIYGPYKDPRPNHSPQWQFRCSSFENVQAVIAMLWFWLSPEKCNQYENAVKLFLDKQAK